MGYARGSGDESTTVGVEATGVTVVGVDGTTLAGAALGVPTLSVVGLLGTGRSSQDSQDIGVIGSERILDPAQIVSGRMTTLHKNVLMA